MTDFLGTPQPCGYCSASGALVYHSGTCPRVKSIEYHPNGTVKRIEFIDGDPPRKPGYVGFPDRRRA